MEEDPFDFNFYLKLPESVYDIKNDRVVEDDLGRKGHAGTTAKSVAKGLSKLLGMTMENRNQGAFAVQRSCSQITTTTRTSTMTRKGQMKRK